MLPPKFRFTQSKCSFVSPSTCNPRSIPIRFSRVPSRTHHDTAERADEYSRRTHIKDVELDDAVVCHQANAHNVDEQGGTHPYQSVKEGVFDHEVDDAQWPHLQSQEEQGSGHVEVRHQLRTVPQVIWYFSRTVNSEAVCTR